MLCNASTKSPRRVGKRDSARCDQSVGDEGLLKVPLPGAS